ncbi:MAG: hypothetical protein IJG13_05415, partial [Kiritimatiellae bacterium]|nr:hypothetical protein [Kiritimatiellia bacterium]
MKKVSAKVSFAVVLCFGAAPSFCSGGQTWYCTKNDTGRDYQTFKTPSYWHLSNGTEMTEFSSEDDYYLCNTTYFS